MTGSSKENEASVQLSGSTLKFLLDAVQVADPFQSDLLEWLSVLMPNPFLETKPPNTHWTISRVISFTLSASHFVQTTRTAFLDAYNVNNELEMHGGILIFKSFFMKNTLKFEKTNRLTSFSE